MTLWIVMAVLTALAALSVLVPLYRHRNVERPAGEEEQAIYRDQLSELERDLARGLIGENEAEAARTEISRRLLRANEVAGEDGASASDRSRIVATVVAAIALPLATLGLYLYLGNPQLSDQPFAERVNAPDGDNRVGEVVARVEAHLSDNPEDGRGWELIGPVYVQLARYSDAAGAFANTIRLLGPSATRESNLGEAIVLANGNVVTAEAREAFERAIALDDTALRPKAFIAFGLDQEGRSEEAIAAWRDLLAIAPANAPWAGVARQELERLGGSAPGVPGPSAEDVEAAEALTSEERQGMIGGMVDRLAERLASDPDDAEGWARLIRSYMVLNRKEDAEAALKMARREFVADNEKLAIVEAEARAVGLIE
jgi:cytochrome c-type biogenesis protein CcmH